MMCKRKWTLSGKIWACKRRLFSCRTNSLLYNAGWRAPAHCGMVNLVRSGTKQPQPISASAAVKARLCISFSSCLVSLFHCAETARKITIVQYHCFDKEVGYIGLLFNETGSNKVQFTHVLFSPCQKISPEEF